MTTDLRPRLPGTLYGLLDAGTRLYQDLDASDALLGEMIAALDSVARAIQRDENIDPLLFEITNTLRICTTGRQRLLATLRHFAPYDVA
ncbi:MAG: hypothetical protein AB7V46_11610 [Thermomicrobiales bacterium]